MEASCEWRLTGSPPDRRVKMKGIYKIADVIISVSSLYDSVHEYCRDYESTGKPDFEVNISQNDIDHERERSVKTALAEGRKPYDASDDYLEELAVYRKISERMPYYDTFLFHGSCIAVDGVGYLFTAASGTGKSTHSKLWREYLGDRAVMVNDDKPLIKVSDNGVIIYGTPYNGKHRLGENISVPLKAVAVLERAEKNFAVPVNVPEVYPRMLQQMYRPSDPVALARSMAALDKMLAQTELYRLGCNMDISAAQTAYNAMK